MADVSSPTVEQLLETLRNAAEDADWQTVNDCRFALASRHGVYSDAYGLTVVYPRGESS